MAISQDQTEVVNNALASIYEDGRRQGQAEASQQFFGKSAAVLTASLFVAAMEQAASALGPHSAEAAAFFHEEAQRIQAFVTPPRVQSHDPQANATGIVADTPIHVHFEGGIREDSLTDETFYVGAASGGPHLDATIEYNAAQHTATLTPTNGLTPGVQYRVTVEGVRARGGMPLEPSVTWTFETASE